MSLTSEEKAQVKAVIERIDDGPKRKLSDEERKTFERAAYSVYNSIGGDAWGDNIPSKREFFDVIVDHIDGPHNDDLTDEQVDRFRKLSTAEKKRIIFAVGP